jgi:hypothetical protein
VSKPKILSRLEGQLRAKGMSPGEAAAVATKKLQASGNLKPGTAEATAKGVKRGAMGAAGRAIDRAVTYGGNKHKPSDYSYSKKTNRATLKGGK